MNRFVFLVAAIAMIVASCSQVEEIITSRDVNEAITFEAYTGRTPVSRAEQISESNHNVFYVFATQHTGVITGETTCDGFMSNEEVKKKEENGKSVWSYSPLKYWKKDDKKMISFFAIGPDKPNGKDESGNFNTNIQYKGLSHSEGETTRHPVHYEYQYTVADNVTKQSDLIYATAVNKKHSDGSTVNLKFKHALASIAFYAKLDKSYGSNVTITITNVKLKGKFYKTGTLKLPIENGVSASWEDRKSTDGAAERTFTISESNCVLTENSQLIYDTNNNGTPYVMVIPQEFGGDAPTIEVTYEVRQSAWSDVQSNTASVSFPFPENSTALSQGTAYNVNMTVSLDAITFTSSCEPWGISNSSHEVNIN